MGLKLPLSPKLREALIRYLDGEALSPHEHILLYRARKRWLSEDPQRLVKDLRLVLEFLEKPYRRGEERE